MCPGWTVKEMVGAIGFEPTASWSRTKHLNPINALFGVAYGARGVISPLLVVPNLYLAGSLQWREGRMGSPDGRAFAVHIERRLKHASHVFARLAFNPIAASVHFPQTDCYFRRLLSVPKI